MRYICLLFAWFISTKESVTKLDAIDECKFCIIHIFSIVVVVLRSRNTVGQYSNSPPPGGYGSRSRGQHHRGGNHGSQSWNQDGRQTDSRRGGQWGGGRGKDYGGKRFVFL